jgi:hypothetical protein
MILWAAAVSEKHTIAKTMVASVIRFFIGALLVIRVPGLPGLWNGGSVQRSRGMNNALAVTQR